MWVWIVIGVVLVAAAVYGFWPRRRGVVDGDVSRGRRDLRGRREGIDPSIRQQFPPGGGSSGGSF